MVSELFQLLRDGLPRTRTELATMTGLARSTVAARIEVLMELGLVAPVGEAVSTGGRPSTQFAIASTGKVVLGVDVGASHLRIGVSDLSGRVLATRLETIDITDGPAIVLTRVAELGLDLMSEVSRPLTDLLAIGVGLPGPVEFDIGMPINPPIMPGWNRFDVPGWLHNTFAAPVLVDNDVNIMALGEREFAWPTTNHLLFVKVATGIGSGVISGGYLQRGAQGTAGDIGHVHIARGNDIPCLCGNFGCLEALAAGPAIARALRESGIKAESSQDVVDLAQMGNIQAIQALRQAGRDIGEVLTTCVSLMNPSVIVMGGSLAQAGEHLIAGVREIVYTRSMPLATEHLQITQSKAGAEGAMMGASILAIHHALSPERIEAMVESAPAKPKA